MHLHGVMLDKWWLEQNAEWQQLVKKWPSPMGGNAGVLACSQTLNHQLTLTGQNSVAVLARAVYVVLFVRPT
jgi:hypothetical protein